MSEIITQKSLDCLSTNSQDSQSQAVKKKDFTKDKDHPQPVDAILLAYMLIYESVITSHKTAFIQSKQIENNGNIQNKLIQEEQGFAFSVVSVTAMRMAVLDEFKKHHNQTYLLFKMMLQKDPSIFSKLRGAIEKAGSYVGPVVDELQMKNEEVAGIRSVLEDKLNVARQDAQVDETGLNTLINKVSSSIQEGGSLVQMLLSLTNQIARI